MKLLKFLRTITKGESTKSGIIPSFRINSNTSTDYGLQRSGSELNSQNISDTSTGSIDGRPPYYPPNLSDRPNNLKIFTFSELKTATKNFSRSTMIGEGGFGCVFRGAIKSSYDDDSKAPRRLEIAVKQLNRSGTQGHREWLAEVEVLGVTEHPNLVKLIGYCAEDDERGIQRLLVYEFMSNKSVETHLSVKSLAILSWPMRLKVALHAARGLTYLHEELGFQIIFRDLKTSNILLDEEWNAKLSDFGLARHGPSQGLSHVSTAVVGTFGYSAPEYLQTGRLTAKSDTWSYGVLLYELITGRPPIDQNRPNSEQRLLEWVKPYITDPKRFRLIIDPRLKQQCSVKSAYRLSRVAIKCLSRLPKSRPKMSEVLAMVQEIVNGMEISDPPQPPLLCLGNEEDVLDEVKKRMAKAKGSSSCKECGGDGNKNAHLKRKLTGFRSAELWRSWRFWKSKHDHST